MADAGDLQRRGFAPEYLDAVALGVPGQVHENIDAVVSDGFRQLFVGHGGNGTPTGGGGAQLVGHRIRGGVPGVAVDVVMISIMVEDQRRQALTGGMAAQVRRNVADTQAPLGIAVVTVELDPGGQRRDELFIPGLALCLLAGQVYLGLEVLKEDDVRVIDI